VKKVSKIQVIAENIDVKTFNDSELPNDLHLVSFIKEGVNYIDAVRAYTKVDIFDEYYDQLKDTGTVLSIKSGYGKIKPKLFGKIKGKEDE
jgi:hypothetical protein